MQLGRNMRTTLKKRQLSIVTGQWNKWKLWLLDIGFNQAFTFYHSSLAIPIRFDYGCNFTKQVYGAIDYIDGRHSWNNAMPTINIYLVDSEIVESSGAGWTGRQTGLEITKKTTNDIDNKHWSKIVCMWYSIRWIDKYHIKNKYKYDW